MASVDWAPQIQNNVDERQYTWDGAVLELDKHKWSSEFRGNQVFLGGSKYDEVQITKIFSPNKKTMFRYPTNHLLRIQGVVSEYELCQAYSDDENGQPWYIVAKDGQKSDLTFRRLSSYEAYVVSDLPGNSWELAIHNLDGKDFSSPGDSGSCIFNAQGKMVGFVHLNMLPIGGHITLATPAHFAIEQIRKQYPKADFDRHAFTNSADAV